MPYSNTSSNLLLKNEFIELKNHKRCTELYLRALWGKGFFLAQGEMEQASFSYIVGNTIYLPRKVSSDPPNLLYYRAAASHAAAHNIYGGVPFCVSDLNLMQRSMIGLIEDL
ncbi:MAG TPA: hypothetical protein VFY78_01740, partial [Gammaproteobacteria bacterium]|nr:hypothetical protein [Gammaproteobacteria bacterium]